MNLRGGPVLFYYVILGLAAGTFILCRALLQSRLGRYWLAIREDAEAAQAVGVPVLRCKMIAIVISAALTALAGVWNAFYYNNLFPETAFAMGRSIEITLAPIIGGLGTLFGPIVGAVVLTGLGEAFTDLGDVLRIPGIKQIFYGLALLVIVMYRPAGVWPWLAAARLQGAPTMSGARLDLDGVTQTLPRPARGAWRQLHRAGRRHPCPDRSQWRGQDHDLQHDRRRLRPQPGAVRLDGEVISGLRPDRICDAGVGRTFQLVKPFKGLSVLENVTVGALHRKPRLAEAQDSAAAILSRLGLYDRRHQLAESLTLPDRKRLEVARALATEPKLLLLDEVMAGLRPTEVDVMVGFLRELNQRSGLTILLIEHVMRAVMALAAEVVVVSYGEKIAEGTPAGDLAAPGRARCLSRRAGGAVSTLLHVDRLDLFYGDAQALDGVSLEIAAGEIVAIVGANGAGKSSLIRTIHGIEKPAHGGIRFDGVDIAGWPSLRVCEAGIGHVAEGRQVFPNLSVLENLEMGATPRAGARAREADPRARLRPLPAPVGAAAAGGRNAVGRRAADAGDRPLPDGPAAADHVRRAVAGTGAHHRAGSLPHHPPPERGGPDHPAGRAERHGLAQDRPSRLRAGERSRSSFRAAAASS